MGKIVIRCVLTAVIISGAATRSFGDQPKAASAAAAKPNILVFYVDDMSWAQPGCYGGQLAPTPNMDQLAKSGVRFTNGYSSGCVCSPGRVGLMTGRYQARSGHDSNTTNHPVSELLLSEVTIAERLKAVGYTTGLVGKWHLGHSSAAYLPESRGFDFSVGSIGNIKAKIGPDEPPFYFRGKETLATLPGAPVTSPVYAREASEFIARNAGHPWFLVLSFNAVHDPIAASPEWVARFSHLPKHPYYAAAVAEADATIGRVMAALREHHQEDNTLIFLLSDNGNGNEAAEPGGLRGRKWTLWEGGIRVSYIASWKDRIPAGRVVHDPVIQLDILPTALAAAGESVQPDWQIDGANLLPLLEGTQPALPPRELYFRFGVQQAVRAGDWKLVKASAEMEPMLVNLATDPGEANDLSEKEPAKRKELETLFATWNATMQPPRWRDHRWDSPEKQVVAPGGPRPKKAARAPAARRMPRVLLIGDSICGGYEQQVRQLLEGTAEVVKNKGNAEYTGEGIKHIDEWLGDGPWDVIHFNWGLWDMYGWRHRAADRSPAMYEQRLEQLVARLEQTGATLIWATTTPACPDPEATMRDRFKESVSISSDVQQQYADAAMRVMKRHGVVINDLHALMWPDLEQYQLSRDNVHFNAAGSERMASQIAAVVTASLPVGEGPSRDSQPPVPRSRRNRLNSSP